MKKLILIMFAALSFAACGSEAPVEENVGEVEQAACAGHQCPGSIPGYPIFAWSVNTSQSGVINCIYRNSSYQYGPAYPMSKVAGCTTCCAPGYCPDPKYGQIVYMGLWSCTAP
jgi:hypothetical protein